MHRVPHSVTQGDRTTAKGIPYSFLLSNESELLKLPISSLDVSAGFIDLESSFSSTVLSKYATTQDSHDYYTQTHCNCVSLNAITDDHEKFPFCAYLHTADCK